MMIKAFGPEKARDCKSKKQGMALAIDCKGHFLMYTPVLFLLKFHLFNTLEFEKEQYF